METTSAFFSLFSDVHNIINPIIVNTILKEKWDYILMKTKVAGNSPSSIGLWFDNEQNGTQILSSV